MKVEFENSVRRLSFLCHLPDIKIAWINPWTLISHPPRDCVKIKVPYHIDIVSSTNCGANHFLLIWLKLNLNIRSVKTDLEGWLLMETVNLIIKIKCFLLPLCCLIARAPKLEVATKKFHYPQTKMWGYF